MEEEIKEQEEKEKKKDKKPKTIAALRTSLVKDFGKKAILSGDDIEEVPLLCSSGSIALDTVIGMRGIPRGRIIECYGPPSGGKTLLTLLMMIECQKLGGVAVFIDLENSFDKNWFVKLGGSLDPDKFILIKPTSGAETFEVIDSLVSSDLVDIIGVDSVSTMATSEELEGSYGDAHMAQLARLMSDGLKKLNITMIKHTRSSVVFINQIRSGMDKYKPEVTTGGAALAFYSSVRIRINRVGGKDGILGSEEDPEGFRTRIKIAKNKVGPPYRTVETSIYVNHPTKCGVDKDEELLDVAMSIGLIKRLKKNEVKELVVDPEGNYYQIEGKDPLYGWPKFKAFIDENPGLLQSMKPAIFEFMNKRVKPEPESFAEQVEQEQKKQRKERKKKEESEEVGE